MALVENLQDLQRHAANFTAGRGLTFTVLDAADDVIGCVYLYPSKAATTDVAVQSWVRATAADAERSAGRVSAHEEALLPRAGLRSLAWLSQACPAS
jgi:hypothetical protein